MNAACSPAAEAASSREKRGAVLSRHGSKLVIYAALGGNLAIALTKLGASLYTGSSAMLTEAIHSLQGILVDGSIGVVRMPSH